MIHDCQCVFFKLCKEYTLCKPHTFKRHTGINQLTMKFGNLGLVENKYNQGIMAISTNLKQQVSEFDC